ncbi:MAG: aspartate ammonia-lyase [Desulfobacteraceae bacterium]|jgi:aspartate ammonia-lyase
MMEFREEKDAFGSMSVRKDCLYGIHTMRAIDNFPKSGLPRYFYLYKALAQVKQAAAATNLEFGYLPGDIGEAIIKAAAEMADGNHFEYFMADALQGGAGTSSNMNINEITANRAGQILSGEGSTGSVSIDPLEHVNLHQSTNDVYPTAVKIAIYYFLNDLEEAVNELQQSLQEKEGEFSDVVKTGRTELMPAVPTTLGREFSAYADAVTRDRWRIFKCRERIRQVNLGGTAIGTGITAPRRYILKVTQRLREITGIPLSRAENLHDATQNHDQIAEVFGMIKTLALNLEKCAGDLRYMASIGEIELPGVQAGSSIMPGKFNPVIPEMISSVSKKIMGNELTASLAISSGELELNAFLPIVAQTILESLDLLVQGIKLLNHKCIKGIRCVREICEKGLLDSPASTALLLPGIGYSKASAVAKYMAQNKVNLNDAVKDMGIMAPEDLERLITPENICSLGYQDE